jgi:hypothetical protein
MLIGRALSERGLTTPAAIGTTLEMPTRDAVALLNQEQRHEGDLGLLEAVASQLGIPDAPAGAS